MLSACLCLINVLWEDRASISSCLVVISSHKIFFLEAQKHTDQVGEQIVEESMAGARHGRVKLKDRDSSCGPASPINPAVISQGLEVKPFFGSRAAWSNSSFC